MSSDVNWPDDSFRRAGLMEGACLTGRKVRCVNGEVGVVTRRPGRTIVDPFPFGVGERAYTLDGRIYYEADGRDPCDILGWAEAEGAA